MLKTTDPALSAPAPLGSSGTAFPIVGIGASAGGLVAFQAFFSGMSAQGDMGMAFVLIQHLAPDHQSMLSELIQRVTRMPVFEVTDGMLVQVNCVYTIAPNTSMRLSNGSLRLTEPTAARGQRLPIDLFFASLARERQDQAIGIVLSGSGSDGALGVRAIKDAGGLVFSQTPSTAEFDGMPNSAFASGAVDHQLAPADMPAQLLAYTQHGLDKPAVSTPISLAYAPEALAAIFRTLRAQTGHDFTNYKPSTMHRRLGRRMVAQKIEAVDEYASFLAQNPAEVGALFNDLLIGVTHFFRDPEAYRALELQVIPQLFEGKPAGSAVRVWCAACSTGEEAYSLAILLKERLETLKVNYKVQVFATDIDGRSIAKARTGVYPDIIAQDISPHRLARFFTRNAETGAYRIHESIRDLLVFSEQSIIKDPPFSKMDLISCRNLLIYLDTELQRRLIPMFHYALNPAGALFLGTSEGVGEFDALFSSLDRKAKLFLRKDGIRHVPRASLGGTFHPYTTAISPMSITPGSSPKAHVKLAPSAKQSVRTITEQALLKHMGVSGVLCNAQGDIIYLHGRTGMYFEPTPGEPAVQNVLKMAREGLRFELANCLRKAVNSGETAMCSAVRVKTNGHFTLVDVGVFPVDAETDTFAEASLAPGKASSHVTQLYLVVLEQAQVAVVMATDVPSADMSPSLQPVAEDVLVAVQDADKSKAKTMARIAALEQELRSKNEYLQSTHEELESSNEELKSSNEEMQSVNEELQSANEEMETSKEELQSVNEELSTVNTELQSKVNDLSRANNDMNNLLAGTGIGTVFVDHQLHIMRFTPAASAIINLIPTDLGRPVGHIVSNLVGYSSMVLDVQAVLDTLVPKEVNVQTLEGKWFTMRIQPYRTLENVIEGVVVSFVDITHMMHLREALAKAAQRDRLAVVVQDAHDAITVQDLEGRTLAWNPGAQRLYGWSEAEALRMNVQDRVPPALRDGALQQLAQLSHAEILKPYCTERLTKSGEIQKVSIVSTSLRNAQGQMYAIATTERAFDEVAP